MPRENKATAWTKNPLDLVQASGQVRPHDDAVCGDDRVTCRVRKWDLVSGSGHDVEPAGILPLAAAAIGLGAHDRRGIDEMEPKLRISLGKQGAEHAGTAANLAEVGAGFREKVSDFTLLGRAARHQSAAHAAE
jgi:hypothetical protein